MRISPYLNQSSPGLPSWGAVKAEIARRERERQARSVELHGDEIRARCRTLPGFVREAWPVLEPNATYLHNWHVDAICDHLQAVSQGHVNRLLINVWPGSMKSLLVSVMWQAWEWGPLGKRSMRFLTTAFNDIPVKRDTRKCRDLIASAWFKSLWPEVELTRAAEMSFANSSTGTREGVAFGSLTSQRGDRLIIDDPHSVKTAESDADRNETTRLFREGSLNRLNDQQRSAIVIVMQRLHANDMSGVILKLGMPFVHLMLPIEFEIERRCATSIGFRDPRRVDGELADPVRFPTDVVESFKTEMGSFAYAGQYQQRPTPREGGLFKQAWFEGKLIRRDAIPSGTRFCRHWDLAATKRKTAAATAGVKIGRTPEGKFIVDNVRLARVEGAEVRKLVKSTAEIDGPDVMISLPQDPGQAGKVQAQDFISLLAGFTVRAEPETGDKETRAEPFSAQCEAGNVSIVIDGWTEGYIAELCAFPAGQFKDQVDASSGAFARLARLPAPQPSLSIIQV